MDEPIILKLPIPLPIAFMIQQAIYLAGRCYGPQTVTGEHCFTLAQKLGKLIAEGEKEQAWRATPKVTAGTPIKGSGA